MAPADRVVALVDGRPHARPRDALAHADAAEHLAAALAAGPPAGRRAELLRRAGARARPRGRAGRGACELRGSGRAGPRGRRRGAAVACRAGVRGPGGRRRRARPRGDAAAGGGARRDRRRRSSGTRARLRARLAVECYYADPAAAESLSEEAVADARASGDPGALAAALNARRVALWRPAHTCAPARRGRRDDRRGPGRPATANRSCRRATGVSSTSGKSGRMDDVRREIDGYEQLADAVGLPHYRWFVPLWRATLALLAGRWDECSALTAEAGGPRPDGPPTPTPPLHGPHPARLPPYGAPLQPSRWSTASGR